MSAPPSPPALRRLDRNTRWELESSVEVQTDVGHPQGLMPWDEHWLVSTVHGDGRGELLVVDADTLAPTIEIPVQAWMPSGRVVTYNGAHVDTPDGMRIRCIVDDQTAAIATWAERR